MPSLSEINHLQELEKFKDSLIQYQSENKYKNHLPKMNIGAQVEKIQGSLRLKKGGKLGKKQKKILEPWED